MSSAIQKKFLVGDWTKLEIAAVLMSVKLNIGARYVHVLLVGHPSKGRLEGTAERKEPRQHTRAQCDHLFNKKI